MSQDKDKIRFPALVYNLQVNIFIIKEIGDFSEVLIFLHK